MDRERAKTEIDLVNICRRIGLIAETPWHYTAGLARIITRSGKPLHEITIGELLALEAEYADRLNREHDRLIRRRFHLCTTSADEKQVPPGDSQRRQEKAERRRLEQARQNEEADRNKRRLFLWRLRWLHTFGCYPNEMRHSANIIKFPRSRGQRITGRHPTPPETA